jgi:sortase B
MKAVKRCRKAIKALSQTVNLTVLAIIMLLITYAGYALWDSNQIHSAADKSHYAKYKPTATNEGKSFKELQTLNDEIIAWLSVYGTNIDYPVTQGSNNMKYVDTNAEGRYSLSGSIFLDYNNSRHFDDFNSIIYGHHMSKKVMFGEIGSFSNKSMFDSHWYGNLYFDEKDHGIEFFAYIRADAYDVSVFVPNVQEADRQEYLDNLLTRATHIRDISISTEDQLVLLATCATGSTNGRDILIGRLTTEVFADPFLNTQSNDARDQGGLVKEIFLLNILLALLLIILLIVIYYRWKNRKGAETHE